MKCNVIIIIAIIIIVILGFSFQYSIGCFDKHDDNLSLKGDPE
jgi:hypothetical protein